MIMFNGYNRKLVKIVVSGYKQDLKWHFFGLFAAFNYLTILLSDIPDRHIVSDDPQTTLLIDQELGLNTMILT